MCNLDFTHLHTHSTFSWDGMAKVREMLERAKEMGMNAIAISDHGNTSSLWEAQQIADEIGIKFIHAIEFYYERENDGANGHLLVLAKNNKGLENIFKMQAYASRHNFHRVPRINWEILKEHAEGLIVTSACLGSTFNQYLISGEYTEAREWARKFQEVFGEDFYIEIQPNSLPEQYTANTGSIRIAKELGIKLVATADSHYTFEDDCFPHEVVLAMAHKRRMSDEKRFRFSSNDYWLKSAEEMVETFEGVPDEAIKEALHTTREIADKCDARIEKGHYLPHFYNIPEGKTEREVLVEHVKEGLAKHNIKDSQFIKDVQHEIDIIDGEGYCGYFLIVQDYINAAKARHELVGDRGSVGGSKVAYLTGISTMPPHEYNLLFERFMAKGRSADIDADFSSQQNVYRDLQQKYGESNVARIMAFATLTAKACIRRVMNAFEHPMSLQNEITKLVPDLCKSLKDAYEFAPELLEYKKKYPMEWEVIERLENMISHTTQHAGGIIIYENLHKLLPLKWDKDQEIYIVEFDKDMLEDIGFQKLDILGLETLPIIENCVQSIKAEHPEFELNTIPLDDAPTYDMLCRGDVSGVFQLAAQASKVMEQQPRNIRDIIAINALVRPGVGDWTEYIARRKGKEWECHPNRLPYLKETEGLIAYQEQYLLDAQVFAGWSIAYADKHLRKNKDIRNDAVLKNKFLEDTTRNGFDYNTALSIWQEIEDIVAQGYGFNKSHSASYGIKSYQTAYLKCHHPTHFYASLMSGEKTDGDGQNAIAGYIAECKQRSIPILPPDINSSGDSFVASDRGIHYRITAIKHVGETAIEHLYELRPITSFEDYLLRHQKSKCNKAVTTNLIKSGAFDQFNENRAELLWQFHMSQRTKTQIKENLQLPRLEWNDDVKMAWEMEVLGMYLSIHPMEKYGFKSIDEFRENDIALQGGEIVEVHDFHPRKDPNNPKMAWITINTLYGQIKVVVFARIWARRDVQELFIKGNIVLVRGRKQGKEILFDSGEVLERRNELCLN